MLGLFCAFMSSVTWAVGSAGYTRLSREFSPAAVNLSRALVALPLFLAAIFAVSGGWEPGLAELSRVHARHFGWFSLSMFCSYGMGDVLFLLSTRSLGVPGALAVASSYPIWTAFLAPLAQGQPVLLRQSLGLALTVAGMALVILRAPRPAEATGGSSASRGKLSDKRVGALLAFATSLLWGFNSFAVARGGADIASAVGSAIRMLLAIPLSFLVGRALFPRMAPVITARAFRAAWPVIVFEAFGGTYFFMYGLSHSPLVIGTTLTSLAPVLAVPVALALGLEKPSLARTSGVVAVVLGLALLIAT